MTEALSPDVLAAAKAGDRTAFESVFHAHIPKLRGVLRRMVGHPDDVDDLAQQTLLKAYEGLGGFRGEASPGTWLCAIGTRLAVDHLRSRKRWRERAQVIYAERCMSEEELGQELGEALHDPGFGYDVNEHIAYCFTCVGRTLEPEAHAALVLRDVVGLSNEEAAKALGLSYSVLRHRLAEARQSMTRTYEGLCALVNKEGVCWQCKGLRDVAAEGQKGEPAPESLSWPRRLQVVREAKLDAGASRCLHDVFFRQTEDQEQERRGSADATTSCGR